MNKDYLKNDRTMIKELTSFPKRARTIDWEDGKLIFDGDKVMLMPELSVEVMQMIQLRKLSSPMQRLIVQRRGAQV